MKFRTRLQVTFFSIILLPLILTVLAFLVIVFYLTNANQGVGSSMGKPVIAENIQEFLGTTDRAYYILLEQAKTNPKRLEDKAYLERLNNEISRKSTYLIVRKDSYLLCRQHGRGEKYFFPAACLRRSGTGGRCGILL